MLRHAKKYMCKLSAVPT